MAEIKMDGKTVGMATMEKEGLYYRICCKCHFADRQIHTVWVLWKTGSRKLGVCVPEGRYACLNTKIPAKHIPDEALSFEIDYRQNDFFYPVEAGKPLGCMDKLINARFAVADGKPGLVVK